MDVSDTCKACMIFSPLKSNWLATLANKPFGRYKCDGTRRRPHGEKVNTTDPLSQRRFVQFSIAGNVWLVKVKCNTIQTKLLGFRLPLAI